MRTGEGHVGNGQRRGLTLALALVIVAGQVPTLALGRTPAAPEPARAAAAVPTSDGPVGRVRTADRAPGTESVRIVDAASDLDAVVAPAAEPAAAVQPAAPLVRAFFPTVPERSGGLPEIAGPVGAGVRAVVHDAAPAVLTASTDPHISGTVYGAGGAVVPGITVRVDQAGGGAVVGIGTTDVSGRYSLAVPQNDTYDVIFIPAKGSGYAVQVFQGQPSTATATALWVGTADVTADAHLVTGYPLTGVVTDTAGRPQAGVSVMAYVAGPGCCYFVRNDTTAADGSYLLELAADTTYKIRFAAGQTYEQWWNGVANPTNDVFTGWSGASAVSVATTTTSCSGERAVLFNNWTIGGVSNGGTAPSFSISRRSCIREIDDYHFNGGAGQTPGTIGLDGPVTLRMAATGTDPQGAAARPYVNWTVVPGLTSWVVPAGTYTCYDSDPATWSFDPTVGPAGFCKVDGVPAVTTTTGTNATANAALSITGTIHGRVTDPSGGPLPGVYVNANDASLPPDQCCPSPAGGALTDAAGAFSFTVPPGSYRVLFNAGNTGFLTSWWNGTRGGTSRYDAATALSVPPDVSLTMTLEPGAQIRGTVTDEARVALGNVNVSAEPLDSSGEGWGAQTDEAGRFLLTVRPGRQYRVQFRPRDPATHLVAQFWHDQYLLERADPVAVGLAGTVLTLDATLHPGVALSGTVSDRSGSPIPGVDVNLLLGGPGAGCGPSSCPSLYARTDAYGHYRIVAPVGPYRPRFHAPYGSPYISRMWDGAPNVDLSADLGLSADRTLDMVLDRGSVVSGRVTDAATGVGIARVGVDLQPEAGGFGIGEGVRSDGSFAFAVPPGRYRIHYQAFDPASRYVAQWWRGRSSFGAADVADLTRTPDLSFDAALATGFVVSGTVRGRDGVPLAGAFVQAFSAACAVPDQRCPSQQALGPTGSDGSYAVLVPAGSWKVHFSAPPGTAYASAFWSAGDDFFTAPALAVSADLAGVDGSLQLQSVIAGTVTAAERPVAFVTVRLDRQDAPGTYYTGTDQQGGYRRTVPPGQYTVRFVPPAPFLAQYWNGAPDRTGAVRVTTVLGETAAGIDASLQTGLVVTGTVTDAGTGGPLQGVVVSLTPSTDPCCDRDAPSGVTGSDGRYAIAVTPGAYKVFFNGGQVGHVLRYYADRSGGTRDFTAALAVTVTSGGTVVDLALPAGRRISGHVYGPAGAPLAGVQVGLFDAAQCCRGLGGAMTDPSGAYSLLEVPGTYRIRFAPNDPVGTRLLGQWYRGAASFATAADVTTATGDVSGVDATLATGVLLSGTVLGSDTHLPLAGVGVSAFDFAVSFDACCDPVASLSTDASGRFVTVVPAGTYRLQVDGQRVGHLLRWYDGTPAGTDRFSLATPLHLTADADLGLSLDRGWRIAGQAYFTVGGTRVPALVGASLYDATVACCSEVGYRSSAFTGTDGHYSFVVPNGRYVVKFGGGRRSVGVWYQQQPTPEAATPIVVTDADTDGRDVELSLGTLVFGTVTDSATHLPLGGIRVTAVNATDAPLTATETAADGTYYLHLPTGTVYLRFSWVDATGGTYYRTRYFGGSATLDGATAISVPTSVTNGYDVSLQAGGLNGVARCAAAALPGATVQLLSGTTVVATTTADANGGFVFATVAPTATYDLRYTSADGTVVCGTAITTTAAGTATAPPPPPSLANSSWTKAVALDGTGTPVHDTIATPRSSWFKVAIAPNEQVVFSLRDCAFDCSLVAYTDIQQAMAALQSGSLAAVQAAQQQLAPAELSPAELSPAELSPAELSPVELSPAELSPAELSPAELSPAELSPAELSPAELSPAELSPAELSPAELSAAYSSAQTRSLLAISAHAGLSPELIVRNTWDNTGNFYIRVLGHNGATSTVPFTVSARVLPGACTGLDLSGAAAATAPAAGAKTLILTNAARLAGSPDAIATFMGRLRTFAARPEVAGVVVDLSQDPGIATNYSRWDAHPTCAALANLVADSIHTLIDRYRALAPALEYIVIAGSDQVVPFRRVPDHSGLGSESQFRVPVGDGTESQAALRQGYFLSQDFYAAPLSVQRGSQRIDVPQQAIGRLVESLTDMTAMLDAYEQTQGLVAPTSALATGYDFIADLGHDLAGTFAAEHLSVDAALIHDGGPTAPGAWTADQLRAKLFGPTSYGIYAINGHFGPNVALAADYSTQLRSDEVAALPASDRRYWNALVLSMGCHAGYSIVDPDALASTQPVAWAEAFNARGATVVGGTGYGYGDTEFIKYSELVLSKTAKQLGVGSSAVPIGVALREAKRSYYGELPLPEGIDVKAAGEATLYGLPMLRFDVYRAPAPTPPSTLTTAAGHARDLRVAQPTLGYTLNRHATQIPLAGTTTKTELIYYDADGNIQTAPLQPVLPRAVLPLVLQDGLVLRGGALVSAGYHDETGLPQTDVATTEVRGQTPRPFASVYTPLRLFAINELAGQSLVVLPLQYLTDGVTGTIRTYDSAHLAIRLYASSRTDQSALADPPSIYSVVVTRTATGLHVDATVGGLRATDGTDDLEDVLVTYTTGPDGSGNGTWSSLSLRGGLTEDRRVTSAVGFSAHFAGDIPTTSPDAVRLFVQAVGGNGLVAVASNNGAYFQAPPVVAPSVTVTQPKHATRLVFTDPPVDTVYGGTAQAATGAVTARLLDGAAGVAGATIVFQFGGRRVSAVTGGDGIAAAPALPADMPPSGGPYPYTATFSEDAARLGSAAAPVLVAIGPAPTRIAFQPIGTVQYSDSAVLATLQANAHPLNEELVTLTVTRGGSAVGTVSRATDGFGRVRFDTLDLGGLAAGAYAVAITYAGSDLYAAASGTASVAVSPEGATLELAALGPQPTGPVTLGGRMIQDADGSAGDARRATVTVALTPDVGTAITVTVPVAADVSFTLTRTLAPAVYTVTASLGGAFFAGTPATALLPVYDPATFATGGGYVMTTPTTTPVADATLPAGKKANFGFTAKYLKGTTTPAGSLVFDLHDGTTVHLAFAATSIDWLVISGGRAEFEGNALLKTGVSLRYRAIAIDGSTDRFEVRLWDPGAGGSFDRPRYVVSNSLGGGQVIVH